MTTQKEMFLKTLRAMGGRASNGKLLRKLKWDEQKYFRLHSELFDDGLIEKGKGYGGSVILLEDQDTINGNISPTTLASAGSIAANEIDLYNPIRLQLHEHWGKRRKLEHSTCEITALQGRRQTGGSWSRPDLTLIGYKKYEYFPQKVFELVTFEVKGANDISIKGVMEALSHRQVAHRSYAIFHTAGRDFSEFPEALRIEDLAAKYGIGVYAAKDAKDFDQWAEIVSGVRTEPDPELSDEFIRRTLSDDAKTLLRKWF